jgi:hypothetical protein
MSGADTEWSAGKITGKIGGGDTASMQGQIILHFRAANKHLKDGNRSQPSSQDQPMLADYRPALSRCRPGSGSTIIPTVVIADTTYRICLEQPEPARERNRCRGPFDPLLA